MTDRPTEPIPPASGGQGPPGGWGAPPPPRPPRPAGPPPWWRRGWVLGVAGFVAGALVGTAGAGEQPVRTVTVPSLVPSLVTVAPTTTTQPPTTGAPPTTRRPTTIAPATTRRPPVTAPPTTRRPATTRTAPPARACDRSYPDFCIPPPPPDLDCPDISRKPFTVVGADPHRFDADHDGLGCER